ncbi:MAG: hypothetical protein AAGJ52_09865 [Pseudomonadota bacterium]
MKPSMSSTQASRGIRASFRIALLALALGASSSVLATSPPPPLPIAELEEFYLATNGDDWYRNDGWLDPDTPICDWYGIRCETQLAVTFITAIELPDNKLDGPIDSLLTLPITPSRIDLSGNSLTGQLTIIPWEADFIDLSNNALDGSLPWAMAVAVDPESQNAIILSTVVPRTLSSLNLSGNQFRGFVPTDWRAFNLSYLNLSNNLLEGSIEPTFDAMRVSSGGELVLTDNRFSGDIPASVIDTTLFDTDLPLSGGGLNLCWNDLSSNDPEVVAFIDSHHVAGASWSDCQNRERQPMDASISGSWFAPERAGEGLSLMLLDTGAPLLYGFTYNTEGQQQWFFELGRSGDQHFDWPVLLETRGDFGLGLRVAEDQAALRQVAGIRLDRLGDRTLMMERAFIDYSGCPPFDGSPPDGDLIPLPCPVSPISDRLVQIQLSRLAGTTCDNQLNNQWISGAWFSPERSGEGFVVEVIEDGRGVVYWFTYTADGTGQQAWLTADGTFNGTTLVLDTLFQPIGARYGEGFDRDAILLQDWGSLTLEFDNDSAGSARFASLDAQFGTGEFNLERLARPMLAECES